MSPFPRISRKRREPVTDEGLFWKEVATKVEAHNWRMGQAMYNVAFKDSEPPDGLVGSNNDPYYSDDNIPGFLNFMRAAWNA